MKINMILMALIISLCSGCTKEAKTNSGIYGRWNLQNGYGTIAGASINYKGASVWEFFQGGEMEVTNKYIGSFDFSPATGQYNYTIVGDKIVSDAGDFFYEISNDTLRLDDRHADGISFVLTRK